VLIGDTDIRKTFRNCSAEGSSIQSKRAALRPPEEIQMTIA